MNQEDAKWWKEELRLSKMGLKIATHDLEHARDVLNAILDDTSDPYGDRDELMEIWNEKMTLHAEQVLWYSDKIKTAKEELGQ